MIILVFILLILFGIWSFNLKKGNLKELDEKIYSKLKIKEPYISMLRVITNLACTIYFVIVCVLLLIILEEKGVAWLFIALMLIDWALIEIFKRIFKRERPNIKRLVHETGYSYPSGHTMSATCFYGFIIFLVMTSGIMLLVKLGVIISLILLIMIIGFSRIYLGVHYFSDVVGAMILSSSYVLLYVYFVHTILNLI